MVWCGCNRHVVHRAIVGDQKVAALRATAVATEMLEMEREVVTNKFANFQWFIRCEIASRAAGWLASAQLRIIIIAAEETVIAARRNDIIRSLDDDGVRWCAKSLVDSGAYGIVVKPSLSNPLNCDTSQFHSICFFLHSIHIFSLLFLHSVRAVQAL